MYAAKKLFKNAGFMILDIQNANVSPTDGFTLLHNDLPDWSFHFVLSVVADFSQLQNSYVTTIDWQLISVHTTAFSVVVYGDMVFVMVLNTILWHAIL